MPDRVHRARARENQRLFRAVNERIHSLQTDFGYFAERSGWICECSDTSCVEHVSMTVPEYEWVLADPRHFVVVPGHADGEAERVIVDAERFAIVELREPLQRRQSELLYYYRLRPERGFAYVSENAAGIVGYTPEEHYADPDLGARLVHPDDRGLLDSIVARPEDQPVTIRWLARGGRLLVTEHRIVPVLDDHGEPVAIAGRATLLGDRAAGNGRPAAGEGLRLTG